MRSSSFEDSESKICENCDKRWETIETRDGTKEPGTSPQLKSFREKNRGEDVCASQLQIKS